MKVYLTIAALILSLSGGIWVASGQKIKCSCERIPDSTCRGTVTCSDGCSAICGSGDTCQLSCRNDVFYERITVKFVKKKGEELAALLSERIHKRVVFVPYPRTARARYTLEIKDDYIWNALRLLNKRGNLKIGGVDFEELRKLQKESRGKGIAVKFVNIPAKDVADRLAFVGGGLPFHVQSEDREKPVSISLQSSTLGEMVNHISATTGIKVTTGRGKSVGRTSFRALRVRR